jgi:hypothetical protein
MGGGVFEAQDGEGNPRGGLPGGGGGKAGGRQEHFDWLRRHLNLMNEIGMENYLIEQLS